MLSQVGLRPTVFSCSLRGTGSRGGKAKHSTEVESSRHSMRRALPQPSSLSQHSGPPRPATEGSRALRARDPQRVRRVRKGAPGPPASGSPRVPEECAPESEKSPKRVRSFWTLFGLRGALFGDSGAPRGPEASGHPFGLFSDSLGVPGPKGLGALCSRPGGSQVSTQTRNYWGWNHSVVGNSFFIFSMSVTSPISFRGVH